MRDSGYGRRRPAAERDIVTPEAQKTYLCGFLTCNVETIPIKEKFIILIKLKQNKTKPTKKIKFQKISK